MSYTKGKLEVIARRDDSCDRPYFDYHLISYPYGIEKGPQRICEGVSKFDAYHIAQCWNSHDALLEACKRDAELADAAILAMPTGEYRTKLTEINILRLQAIKKAEKETK